MADKGRIEEKTESPVPVSRKTLSARQYQGLAEIPPEIEWFANIDNPRTRRAYRNDIRDFTAFAGILRPEEFRTVARAHVIAWRDALKNRNLAPATIRRKLSALASLFDYLCDQNAVAHNPVDGVKRPRKDSNEGKTPALSDEQARALLEAPPPATLKGKRDRAILATLLYHAFRRQELCDLRVRDFRLNRGNRYFAVRGKGGKARNVLVHPLTIALIREYMDAAGHGQDLDGALFRPVKNNRGGGLNKHLAPEIIYKNIVIPYAKQAGIYFPGVSPHALRTTAATNALDNGAELAKVQEWLGHADVSTTRMYDKRQSRPEESPSLKVGY